MNPWAIIPLVSCVAYAALAILVLQQVRTRVNKVFALFLLASGMWSISAFILTSRLITSTQYLILWNNLVIVGVVWSMVSYYHFVRSYTNRPGGIRVYLGYALVLTIVSLSFTGNVVRDAYMVGNYLYHDMGPWMYVLIATLFPILLGTMWLLVKRYRTSTDPADRNRTMYLLVGWGIMGSYSAINANVPLLALLPTDHLGTLANAVIISVAILRFQLLDVRFVARRVLAFAFTFTTISVVYTSFLFLLYRFFSGQPFLLSILIITAFTALVSVLGRPLRHLLERWVDRLFHRETYVYRQALLDFRRKMGNILNLEELANEMLPTVCGAIRVSHAKLLFQEPGSGEFTIHFAYPPAKEEASEQVRLSADNPVVTWLAEKDSPLQLEQMGSIPQLKGLWTAEREELAASGLELLHPITSGKRLIGILALGKKNTGALYYPEDIGLVTNMASQAGTVIENAQLYAEATTRANTDGLTGLYNHRHFHERIEQEIARGSRFGTIFSLVMLDIDLFKGYNDIYGHQAGDKVLQRMGEHIRSSIRSIDMAFRYGGEEFAIVLPETQLDDAYKVTERIRKTIETKMSSKAMPTTVSLGIASWPADGVTKEEVIACADVALYRAKETGRNRTCLSADMAKPGAPLESADSVTERGALSIIYALAATVDAKDHYTYGHSKKVSEYAVAAAEMLGLPADRTATIRAAALLHDIGKIGVPDSILNKQGPLTKTEWEPIKEHPQLGVEILRHVIDLINCLPAILHHHEHYDGTGYPFGLEGNNIPLEARILAIADTYDAITSLRPYRKRLSPQQAFSELKRCAGTQFDPKLVELFCRLMEPVLSEELEKDKV